ncbi:hypothetical protein [Paeniglutamicibacter sulfureus]|uniref:Uncharacterized protein n=1 Tax=Paeniglutamicibacter sulfureus TaxID=43666 RepID=A0ABU2BCP5_9MICC|nr:hypothetical protein [Paeniglutamicibacter sulfureus]MDR7356378.1 hypothetical protein [Paeniglutamicibacter sulfureus]
MKVGESGAWVSRKVSDLSGKEGKDDAFTNVVVRTHPGLEESVQFDALPDELKGLKPLEDLVQLELRHGTEIVELVVTLEEFNKLSPKIQEVLDNADGLKGRRKNFRPGAAV